MAVPMNGDIAASAGMEETRRLARRLSRIATHRTMDKVHARKNSFSAPVRYRGHNRTFAFAALPSVIGGPGCNFMSLPL
jgi:hypothetical protein